jgi:hypothetical protein
MTAPARSLCSVCFHRHRLPGSARCQLCGSGRTPAPTTRPNPTIPTPEETL